MGAGARDYEHDAELMQRLQRGEDDCFNELMLRHWNYVRMFAQRIVRNEAASEDIAQETFLRVYGARFRYQPAARFTTWLGTITSHLSLNWIRNHRQERLRVMPLESNLEARGPVILRDGRPRPDEQLELDQARHELLRRLSAAIHQLPHRQKRALCLQLYEGLGYAGIARRMGCSEHSVKSLLFRAHRSLREQLGPREPGSVRQNQRAVYHSE